MQLQDRLTGVESQCSTVHQNTVTVMHNHSRSNRHAVMIQTTIHRGMGAATLVK